MSSIDNKVVSMKFDNRQFVDGVKETIGFLEKLKSAMGFKDSAADLNKLQNDVGKFDMSSMTSATDKVSAGFMAMATIAITALANIANRAIDTGVQMAKALTVEPVGQGFQEFELKMGAIQTIMAGSGASLEVVNKKLSELNNYADKTIYSFADMTQNIGKFTNAGVGLDQSVAAIQGVANVAAISGANANEASRAMYNFAQSLSQGSVKLMDWKSIELANMATAEFKQQLIDSAVAAGTLTDAGDGLYRTLEGNVLSATKGFNESLGDQWLTSEALISTLNRYSDTTTDIGKRATAAAQDVKTFSQMIDTMKESAASGWAETFELIVGDFEQGKSLWTGINNIFGGMITSSANARNELLKGWNMLGGREVLIEGMKNAWESLSRVLGAVKEAFQNVFPPKTAQDLFNITESFRDFTERLKPSETTIGNLRRAFEGLFSIFAIGQKVFSAVIGLFGDLFGVVLKGSGGFTGLLGDLGAFFTKLNDGIPSFELFGNASDVLRSGIDKLKDAFGRFGDFIGPVIDQIKDFGTSVMEGIKDAFSGVNVNWDTIFSGLTAGGLGGIALGLRKLIKDGIGINIGGGFLDGITDAMSEFSGLLQSMQTNLKADALMKIGAAIALLTGSILILSGIDADALAKAVATISVSFAILYSAMVLMSKITMTAGFLKMPFIAAGMIILATALVVFASSVKKMSELSWDELGRGLAGTAGALGIFVVALKLMPNPSGLISTGLGLVVLSTSLLIMSSAISKMAGLSWSEIGTGLAGVAGSLAVLIAAMKLMPPDVASKSVGLFVLGGALHVLASAVQQFSDLEPGEVAAGLLGIAGSLAVLVVAIKLMPSNMFATAAGLGVVALALLLIQNAVESFGSMSWDELARGLVALGGSLLILAGGLYLMTGALPGAFALIVAAGAIAVLTPALAALGNLSLQEILTALVALGAAFAVIGVAGLLIGPILPLVLGLGAALMLLGTGLALAGAGALAFAAAFSIVTNLYAQGTEAMAGALDVIIEAIPKAIRAFGEGIIEFINVIANSQTEFVNAFVTVLSALLEAGITLVPKAGELFRTLMEEGIRTIRLFFPRILQLGMDLVVYLLDGIARNIGRIANSATDVIIAFIRAISNNTQRVVRAGMETILSFINGLTDAVNRYMPRIRQAGVELAMAIVDGMTGGLASAAGRVASRAAEMARSALDAAKSALGISSPSKAFMEVGRYSADGLADGLVKYGYLVENSAESVASTALNTIRVSMRGMSDILSKEMDVNPVITPVIDLTNVSKGAALAGKMFDTSSIQAGVTYSKASAISAERQAAIQSSMQADTTEPTKVEFVQNNYSPKALTAVEIYRNTRNQLSLAKEAMRS